MLCVQQRFAARDRSTVRISCRIVPNPDRLRPCTSDGRTPQGCPHLPRTLHIRALDVVFQASQNRRAAWPHVTAQRLLVARTRR